MKSEELKPCPFCAGKAVVMGEGGEKPTIVCIKCGIGFDKLGEGCSIEKQAEHWNTRALPREPEGGEREECDLGVPDIGLDALVHLEEAWQAAGDESPHRYVIAEWIRQQQEIATILEGEKQLSKGEWNTLEEVRTKHGSIGERTHYEGCWREHHDCAVAWLEASQKALGTCKRGYEGLLNALYKYGRHLDSCPAKKDKSKGCDCAWTFTANVYGDHMRYFEEPCELYDLRIARDGEDPDDDDPERECEGGPSPEPDQPSPAPAPREGEEYHDEQ